MSVRVRFAPSPTGPFSLGNARTALFNWLFTKHEGGKFLLRIENTDKERSKKEYEKDIIKGLEWLGLDWDEELSRQSERLEIYEKYLNKLLEDSKAYYCFCTAEELDLERGAQLSQGLSPKYSGKCRSLKKDEVEARLKKEPAVIRFKMPEKQISFHDIVRGKVEFNTALMGDIIIAKSLKEPLYNFSAAIDDFDMKISHVIRGEDHLSNTPKQIAIQEALGFSHPHYAHLPLILGPDKKKLSKRYLDKSMNDYRNGGYLPEAFLNFLVLLGWHPVLDREIISREDMVKEFDLKRVQKGGAVFNPEKLDWLNAKYIKNIDIVELLEKIKDFIPTDWQKQKNLLKRVLELEKNRLKNLKSLEEIAGFFFALPDYPAAMLIWQKISKDETAKNLASVAEILKETPNKNFLKNILELKIMDLAEKLGRGEVLWPLRVALSGRGASPGPIEIIEVLGKEESLRRIDVALQKISSPTLPKIGK